MSLRFQGFRRIGIVGALVVVGCSTDDSGTGGTAGSTSGGMSSAGTAAGGSASGASSTGGSSGTPASGGSSTSGASAGGVSGGAATSGAAGAGGAGASGGSGTAGASGGSGTAGGGGSGGAGGKSKTTFFVTSDTRTTGKLGSLESSDKRCQDLAVAAGLGDHTFRAYLSTMAPLVHAKDRIGTGPWHNSKGALLAADLAALHAPTLKGDPAIFLDEKGAQISGQWNGGNPNEHDILTGSNADGTAAAATCKDWTSDSAADKGQVGHSDGMGPGMATTGTYSSWNSAHPGGSCADTSVAGGKGRIYCFAID